MPSPEAIEMARGLLGTAQRDEVFASALCLACENLIAFVAARQADPEPFLASALANMARNAQEALEGLQRRFPAPTSSVQ